MPFFTVSFLILFGWEGSPTKIDYRKKGTLILTTLLEDLVHLYGQSPSRCARIHGCAPFKVMYPACIWPFVVDAPFSRGAFLAALGTRRSWARRSFPGEFREAGARSDFTWTRSRLRKL